MIASALDLEGWFGDEEGRWYAELASAIPRGGALVEVGSWKGRSASFAGPVCRERGIRFVLVDHFAGSRDAYAAEYAARLAREDVRAILERNLAALAIPYELWAIDSRAAAARLAPGSIDAVFLDASHDGPSVRADLEAWWPRVRAGGIVAGHDFSSDHLELVGEVASFCARHDLELARGPGRIWCAGTPGAFAVSGGIACAERR